MYILYIYIYYMYLVLLESCGILHWWMKGNPSHFKIGHVHNDAH